MARGLKFWLKEEEAKTKVLISCTVTAQLICAFVFAYTKSRFSYEATQINLPLLYSEIFKAVKITISDKKLQQLPFFFAQSIDVRAA